ncbi:hypothetical protein P152DRAFT_455751 [Eremomyces bilateralis CBS 781.70]|uniref:Uncharacterized protein n=1 Tax=Eremomyces bilateralis CBS 781.70 TaxID=1392243 RepID=A0A6G1G9L4_9PEZI|nr:uncharacterized protein P152DRAFT_455751 [Eremomyces bilateralis CBS 781.70]KAF1814713.1 hypothetical protein P152DRAFT_455751 [Eremomyces bilateralis CBS 781.70]
MRLAALFLSALVSTVSAASSQTVTLHAWPTSAPTPTPFATVVYSTAQTPSGEDVAPQHKAEIKSFTSPIAPTDDVRSEDASLFRIGHFDRTKHFSSSLASSVIFAPGQRQRIVLHVDEHGELWRTELHSATISAPEKKKKKPTGPSKPKSQKRLEREAARAKTEAKEKARKERTRLRKEGKLKPGEKLPVTVEEEPAQVVVEIKGPNPGAEPVLNAPVTLNPDGRVEGAEGPEEKTFLQKYWWLLLAFIAVQVLVGGNKE